MKVGYAPGAWDLFHVGHLNVLRHARSECDYLVAGVVDDDMTAAVTRPPGALAGRERAATARHDRSVHAVFVATPPDKREPWRQRPFDVFFKGDDWRGTPKGAELERRFAEVGVEVVYFPYTVHTSSTALRRALTLLEPTAGLTVEG